MRGGSGEGRATPALSRGSFTVCCGLLLSVSDGRLEITERCRPVTLGLTVTALAHESESALILRREDG
ncbi:hypothetical protein BN6_68030 [Saccharothrix espanaensis DSM 44229]|uniref:Uncharacterized protein n=1 Tax=Saccharothrix espanaensis (strain ATCC 51144 / DSM 44229 / JCM 9112 / NBRC 15066 / NRRL 15764) TaxID=1179773 RepID=K0K1D7_SACES|nr:hypothetical protein BN6_68030 [Saccharothrix espanaensis DSM 44229]